MRYYGVPSLSLRQALHAQLRQTPQLHTQYWWSPNISNDQLHPNCVGHKWVPLMLGSSVLAALRAAAVACLQLWRLASAAVPLELAPAQAVCTQAQHGFD